jgi:hypothetical protein
MKECPNCAVEIRDDARVCPICKYEYGATRALPWNPVAALLLAVLLVPLILALFRALGR